MALRQFAVPGSPGEFALWPMAHAWKACWVQALGGSNPPFSAFEMPRMGPREAGPMRGISCLAAEHSDPAGGAPLRSQPHCAPESPPGRRKNRAMWMRHSGGSNPPFSAVFCLCFDGFSGLMRSDCARSPAIATQSSALALLVCVARGCESARPSTRDSQVSPTRAPIDLACSTASCHVRNLIRPAPSPQNRVWSPRVEMRYSNHESSPTAVGNPIPSPSPARPSRTRLRIRSPTRREETHRPTRARQLDRERWLSSRNTRSSSGAPSPLQPRARVWHPSRRVGAVSRFPRAWGDRSHRSCGAEGPEDRAPTTGRAGAWHRSLDGAARQADPFQAQSRPASLTPGSWGQLSGSAVFGYALRSGLVAALANGIQIVAK